MATQNKNIEGDENERNIQEFLLHVDEETMPLLMKRLNEAREGEERIDEVLSQFSSVIDSRTLPVLATLLKESNGDSKKMGRIIDDYQKYIREEEEADEIEGESTIQKKEKNIAKLKRALKSLGPGYKEAKRMIQEEAARLIADWLPALQGNEQGALLQLSYPTQKDKLYKDLGGLVYAFDEMTRHQQLEAVKEYDSMINRVRKALARAMQREAEEWGVHEKIRVKGQFFGEGGYAKVYFVTVNGKPKAIKVLRPEIPDRYLDYHKIKDLPEVTRSSEYLATYDGRIVFNQQVGEEKVVTKNREIKPDQAGLDETVVPENQSVPILESHRADILENLDGWKGLGKFLNQEMLNMDFPTQLKELYLPALKGVKALHDQGWVHLDLKPDNILVNQVEVKSEKVRQQLISEGGKTKQFFVKVSDYDNLRKSGYRDPRGNVMGTPLFISPEHWLNQGMTEKSDIYALGIVLLEMMVGKNPLVLPGGGKAYFDRALNGFNIDEQPIDPLIKGVIQKCLSRLPSDRHTIDELIADIEAIIALYESGDYKNMGLSLQTPLQERARAKASYEDLKLKKHAKKMKEAEKKYSGPIDEKTGDLPDRTVLDTKLSDDSSERSQAA